MSPIRDFRTVFRPVGAALLGIALAQFGCWVFGMGLEFFGPKVGPQRGLTGILYAFAITFVVGGGLFALGHRYRSKTVTRREAMLTVTLIWFTTSLVGALPFVLGTHVSFVDAVFESASGLTTTGATVFEDVEHDLSRAMLVWRSLIQWLGGMGIVVLFVAIFPSVGAGGKHLFREEVPGTTVEGLKPRIAETSFALWRLYVGLTALQIGVLWLLGMPVFDALCHALTTMSTGGFSTKNASVAGFGDPAIEYVIAVFMLIASVNYGLYYAALRGRSLRAIPRSLEFRVFVYIVVLVTLVMTFGIRHLHGGDVLVAFRYAFFMVATTISSTGYGTDDYMAYPSVVLMLVIFLMFVGGCAGSTAGGLKVERLVLMAKLGFSQMRRSFRPQHIRVIRLGDNVAGATALTDVGTFLAAYFACLMVGTTLVCWFDGVPPQTAFGAMLTCLSNMGPAAFHIGPDHFVAYSAGSKMIFVFVMILGRLEIFTLLALLVPDFWKR